VALTLASGPAGAGPAGAQQVPSGKGGPALLLRGSAGLAFPFGSLLSAGLGAGWRWTTLEVGLLGGYSRRVQNEIVLWDGERWTRTLTWEGTAWAAVRPSSSRLFRLAALVSAGRGTFTRNDLGQRYATDTLSWTVGAGPGIGPAFLLLGVSGPAVTVPYDRPAFHDSLAVHLSLNLTLDLLTALRPTPD
jgi:hypothetical protein